MSNKEKIIHALERCNKCEMSVIASDEGHKAYIECEYTLGLYCRIDQLIFDTSKFLKEQPDVIRCENCMWFEPENIEEGDCFGKCRNEHSPCYNQQTDMIFFCADGERKER